MAVMVQEVGEEVMVIVLEEEGVKGLAEVEAAVVEVEVVNIGKEAAVKMPVMMAATGGLRTSGEHHSMVRAGKVGKAHRNPDQEMTAEVA